MIKSFGSNLKLSITKKEHFGYLKCISVLLVSFVLSVVIFNAFIGFGVIFCINEHTLKILFTFLENVQKCETISYEMFCAFKNRVYTNTSGGKYYWYFRR